MQKIKKLKGTFDLFGKKLKIINYIIKIIKKKIKLYGFQNLKTPSIENINLLKKFKIKNKIFYSLDKKKFLIFDLTLPLIRFFLNNKTKILLPFKRYQIQKVWRGEKPQKNRWREFIQFDADIITYKRKTKFLLELIYLTFEIFKKLKIKIFYFINHKFILYGLCQFFKIERKKWEIFLIFLEKKNKINFKKILNILFIKNIINKKQKKNIKNFFKLKKKERKKKIKKTKYGSKGFKELEKFLFFIKKIKLKIKIFLKINLSRGFTYYNGIIFEIINKKNKKISLLGGGEYNLIKEKKIYSVGLSFGIFRIYNLFLKKKQKNFKRKVLILNIKKNFFFIYFKISNLLRKNNIITEIYPYKKKIKKQIKYAIFNKIKFLIFFGKKEKKEKKIKIKNLKKKKELILNLKDKKKIIDYLKFS